jgi:hypothetical protein
MLNQLYTNIIIVIFAVLSVVSSLVSAVEVDSNGLRVLTRTPPVGQHPRVLFTEQDRQDIKQRLYESKLGETVMVDWLEKLEKSLPARVAPLMKLDIDNLDADAVNIWMVPDEARQQDWGALAVKSWVDDNDYIKKILIDSAVRHAKVIIASKTLTPNHEFWAPKSAKGNVTGDSAGYDWNLRHEWILGKGFAMIYDCLYNDMTTDQRSVIRKAIAMGVKGRRSHGMGKPDTLLFSNHVPLHGNMCVISLAIEGEEGYDPEIYELWVKMMKGWASLCLSKGGANHEDGYIYYAFRGGFPVMVAAQRRGEKLFDLPNVRNVMEWQTHWEPVALEGRGCGGYQTFHVVLKYMYPNDPFANMFWRRRVGADYQHPLTWQSLIDTVIFGGDWDGDKEKSADPGRLGIPPYAYDARRGVQIVRNSWADGDLQFRFSARPDVMFVGHAAVDSGSFDLEALGRKWVYNSVGDKVYSFSSKDFSLVHIDGKSESMKPPTVKTLFARDMGLASVICADLTYAYNWRWYYGWPKPGGNKDAYDSDNSGHGLPQKPWVPEKNNVYDLGWPKSESWMPKNISNLPDYGYIGLWQYKERINQVGHVYRTAVTVRGDHPYVLIVDDVNKDGKEHLYEWYMQTPQDVDLALLHEKDIILREHSEGKCTNQQVSTGGIFKVDSELAAPGSKRLLVRALAQFEDMTEQRHEYYGRLNFLSDVRMEEHQYGHIYSHGNMQVSRGKRLVVPNRGTDGDFKMLLFPYETTNPVKGDKEQVKKAWQDNPAGAKLPITDWNENRDQLTVKIGDQVDEFKFEKTPDGRTTLTITRSGQQIFCE